jgi:hypothetical protein
VRGKRSIGVVALWLGALMLPPALAHAGQVQGNFSLLGQVREGDFTRKTESPQDIYGDIGVSGLPQGIGGDTYFRLEHDFSTGQGPTEFYNGYLHIPATAAGADVTIGRQFLSEGPGGVFVADAGKVRLDPGGPFSFTVFGGRPHYFEPTYSTDILSQDEILFGGNIRTTHWKHGTLSLGFLQQEREDRVIRQLVTGTGSRSFTNLPGLPNLYGTVAYDADRQNLDQATAGFDVFLSQPRLSFNFESGYYKPQDQGKHLVTDINRREDAIFELFSLSQMLQFRGGLRYALSRSFSAYGDYSYQRYEKLANVFENGQIGSVGLLWLPGGDGLEVVRLEYYVLDSSGGNVNGAKAYYESRVYERILFRTKVDVGYYEKENNERDTAVNTLLGVGYAFTPNLTGELDFEANRNRRFNEDFRFGFLITYRIRHPASRAQPPRGVS